jgi:hypothetical protein
MNFILKKYNNVWKVVKPEIEDGFYYLDVLKIFRYSDGVNDFTLIDHFKCEIIESWNEGFLINENVYFEENESTSLFDANVYKQLILDNESFIVKKLDFIKESLQYGIYNFKEKSINYFEIKKTIKPVARCLENNFISYFNKEFAMYSKDFTEKWEILLSEYDESENAYMDDNFIIRRDKLFFTLLGTSNNRTICIDINTGQKIGEYKELVGWLYADENMIYNVRYGQTLVSLNVGTGELLEWDMKELLIENDLEYLDYSIWLVRNGFLYFAHNIGADKNSQLKPAKVGIINLKTKELDWQYSLEKEYGVIGDIKVFGERLFVQTQANTLHVFEAEVIS